MVASSSMIAKSRWIRRLEERVIELDATVQKLMTENRALTLENQRLEKELEEVQLHSFEDRKWRELAEEVRRYRQRQHRVDL